MPKGNPNPTQTEAFKAARFRRADGSAEPLADKNIQVRLTRSVDTAIRGLPDRSAWMRRVLTEAAKSEGLI